MTDTTDTAPAKPPHAAGPPRVPTGRRPAPSPRSGRGGLLRRLTPWLFLAVPLVLLVAFTYVPVANMVYYSFTDWDGVSPDRNFTGIDN
ncbi:sugar ABC transporter permease, partial [Streptomyces sp. NPDC052020]